MNFQHGIKFDLTVTTGDTFAAATVSSLLTAADHSATKSRPPMPKNRPSPIRHRLGRR